MSRRKRVPSKRTSGSPRKTRQRIKPLSLSTSPRARKTRFFVYVLGSRRNADCRTYVGWSTDLERRLRQHNAGAGAKSTRGRTWVLLYWERCKTRNEAMSREWYIKRDRKFRALLRETMPS